MPQQLLLLGAGSKGAAFVEIQNGGDDRVGVIDQRHQPHILCLDEALRDHRFFHPRQQAAPEIAADENHRNLAAFAGLNQHENFRQLIERTEAAGHHHIGVGVFDEHHLAREKVAEFQRNILKLVR